MSAQTVTFTTSSSVNKFWRKVQGDVVEEAFANGKREEYKEFSKLQQVDEDWSAYENTFPLDLNERGGIASIPDSGAMAVPSSVNAVEATITAVHFNGRFTVGNIAQWADKGQRNQLMRQIVAQSKQKGDAMTEHFSDYWYGFASGLMCTTDSDISGTTGNVLTLAAGYGVAGITNAKYLASMWKVGDRGVMTDSSNALINTTSSWFTVTAVSKSAGTITVTMDGSTSYTTNGIRLYKANSIEGLTLAGGSDYLKGLNGMLDRYTSTSNQNVSGSSNPNWNAAYTDTNTGLFTPTKQIRAKNEIKNNSGLDMDTIWLSQGVMRSMIGQQSAGVRFDSPVGMSFDGDVKSKVARYIDIKGVPPGYVFCEAKAATRRWEIKGVDGDKNYGDLQPSENYAASYGRIDWMGNPVTRSRMGYALFTNQTES